MEIPDRGPIVVAVALDDQTQDVLRLAEELCLRLGAPLLPVHVAHRFTSPDAAERGRLGQRLADELATTRSAGVEVLEPVILSGPAATRIVEHAQAAHAVMIVTGGGGPATVRRWVFGSTAEAIVRTALIPVFVVRGGLPMGHPVLTPVDLSPSARVGLTLALRMARAFETSLTVLHVLPEPDRQVGLEALEHRVDTEIAAADELVRRFLEAHDTKGIAIDRRIALGDVGSSVVEHADDAGLLVMASRSFSHLRPGTYDDVDERAVRFSRSNVLTLRDPDPDHAGFEAQLERVGDLKTRADALLDAGDAMGALPLLQLAASLAPANAALQDRMADALEALGRTDESAGRRRLAAVIRTRFG